jgi:hypothetical protein
MNNLSNWKIFIVTHGPVVDDYYANDPEFSPANFVLFNVSNTRMTHDKFQVMNKSEILGYVELGKWYAEAEVIYNVFKCGLYAGLDYIGFVHWDYELRCFDPTIGYHVSKAIRSAIDKDASFISFSTFDFMYAYNLNVMLDINYPNQCYGDGKNCFDAILEEYNEYYGKNILLDDIKDKQINLCSAFLLKRSVFEDLMGFYMHVIDMGYLNQFDTQHEYRFQGGILERYIGIYSSQYDVVSIPLDHHYDHKKEASKIELRLEKVRKYLSNIKKRILNR